MALGNVMQSKYCANEARRERESDAKTSLEQSPPQFILSSLVLFLSLSHSFSVVIFIFYSCNSEVHSKCVRNKNKKS